VTIAEAVEIMRNMTGESADSQCQFMAAAADVWDEAEGVVQCKACDGSGLYRHGDGRLDLHDRCPSCDGDRYRSNGNSLRAEALRLLAECGKVGGWVNEQCRYWTPVMVVGRECVIPAGWWTAAGFNGVISGNLPTVHHGYIGNRLDLIDAYAAADRPTREAWARETRKLAGWEACGCRKWMEGGYSCPVCQGYGLVPPAPTEVQS